MDRYTVIRHMDDLGRCCIPKDFRRYLNIEPEDEVEIWLDEDKIVMRKYEEGLEKIK